MKRRFAVLETLERALQPSDSEQDSDDAIDTEDDTDDEVEFALESDSDASSEGEQDPEEAAASDANGEWKSKNGQIVWYPTDAETLRYSAAKRVTPGPTRYATARISTVKSCFDLFITDEIVQLILDMTNLQGRRAAHDWEDVEATDLQAYIGLLILSGVYRSRSESTRSLWDDHTGRAIFRHTMSYGKFNAINSNVRFDDMLARGELHEQDKLAAFRTIWEKWTRRLPLLFNPGQDVCVDEQLVPFKGRCPFRQYMPKKPVKHGIKMWVTCDVLTSYAWNMQIHTGKPAGSGPEVNQRQRVALDMTEGLRGNTVTCDRLFTSYALAEELLKRKLALVGTVRKHRPELPRQLLQTRQRAIRSSLFAFTRTHTAVSYLPKRRKNVLLLSTKHREPAVSNREHQKPKVLLDYNRCKGGGEKLDKVVGTYSCRRRTCWWPLALFYHILDVSAHNAFVLWTEENPSWNQKNVFGRRVFMEELGKMLVSPQLRVRPGAAAAATEGDQREPGDNPEESGDADGAPSKRRRLCEFCSGRKKKKISTTCVKCGKFICKDHTTSYCHYCCCKVK